MDIDLTTLSSSEIYFTMTQSLVPRPIAWVLTENEAGDFNLAPFSYFSAVSSDPPLIMISLGKKPDGSPKDTRVNIEQRNNFVVHIPSRTDLQGVNDSSATLPEGVSEVEKLGLELTVFEGSPLPRLAQCRIAMACERYEIKEIGDTPQTLIFGLIKQLYIDDRIVTQDAKGRLKISARELDPLGRLGASEYLGMGEVISLVRPE
ncbi:MAG: flavin reductase family protein [Gammaproteobacteria bacterium]|nr:flavin reductase family protein [Gammaproteobacteria bacterium]